MRVFVIVLGVFLMILGAVLARAYFVDLSLWRSSEDWPSITGEITEVSVVTKRQRGRTGEHPSVRYAYQVEGKSYVGNQICFEGLAVNDDEFESYHVGQPVQVYYRPDNPQTAVLVPGAKLASPMTVLFLLFTVLLTLLGAFLAWLGKVIK